MFSVGRLLATGAGLAIGSTTLAAIGAARLSPTLVIIGSLLDIVALVAINAGFTKNARATTKKRSARTGSHSEHPAAT